MKTFSGPLLIVLILVPALHAQTESFDIATFVRPHGWTRAEPNGVLLLQNRRGLPGREEFCQIYVFPSTPTKQDPGANFQSEWDKRIIGSLGFAVRPSGQNVTTSDGWTVVSGVADGNRQGLVRSVLVTATGFGKFVTIVVMVSPGSYQAEIDKFFQDLNLNAAAGARDPQGDVLANLGGNQAAESRHPAANRAQGGTLEKYLFTTPTNWSREQLPDRIMLTSPMYDNGERCQLSILPMRSSSQPLSDDAIGAFRQLFQADPLTSYPSPPPRLARGVSPQGWEYFSIRKLVGGQEGEARTIGVTLLVARLDSEIATIVGTSKDFLFSRCFGQMDGDAWPGFFSSLQFTASLPVKEAQAGIKQRLEGTWIMATGSMGLRYQFLSNGRYQGAVATQQRSRDTETTRAFFGDGAYTFDGNTIVFAGDDHRRSTDFFRLEQVSKDSGQTWGEQLCLLDPGATGEVCYRKE
jgi:hypothetical protein